jgi:hypothetical protein
MDDLLISLPRGRTRFFDPAWVGNVTPFCTEDHLNARVLFARDLSAFERVLGVSPHSIFTVYPPGSLRKVPKDPERTSRLVSSDHLLLDAQGFQALRDDEARASATVLPSIPVKVLGDELLARTSQAADGVAYLSVPYSQIGQVITDGRSVPFFRADLFGIAFRLAKGAHVVSIKARRYPAYLVMALFFGSYLIALLWLLFEWRLCRITSRPI